MPLDSSLSAACRASSRPTGAVAASSAREADPGHGPPPAGATDAGRARHPAEPPPRLALQDQVQTFRPHPPVDVQQCEHAGQERRRQRLRGDPAEVDQHERDERHLVAVVGAHRVRRHHRRRGERNRDQVLHQDRQQHGQAPDPPDPPEGGPGEPPGPPQRLDRTQPFEDQCGGGQRPGAPQDHAGDDEQDQADVRQQPGDRRRDQQSPDPRSDPRPDLPDGDPAAEHVLGDDDDQHPGQHGAHQRRQERADERVEAAEHLQGEGVVGEAGQGRDVAGEQLDRHDERLLQPRRARRPGRRSLGGCAGWCVNVPSSTSPTPSGRSGIPPGCGR